MHAFKPWHLCAAFAALAFAVLPAQADDKLIDGFGVDQTLDGSFITGADILAGSRDLVALAAPDPAAVRIDSGRLFIDTRTTRAVVRYASPQAGGLFNLALDDADHHGDWLLTYRATRAVMLEFIFHAQPAPDFSVRALHSVLLEPSASFVTINLGPIVEPEFPLFLSRSLALQLASDGTAGSLEIDALRLTAPAAVPEPATAALWLAGVGALAAFSRRTARRPGPLEVYR